MMTITVSTDQAGMRLDMFVIDQMPELSRSFVTTLIKQGRVLLEGESTKTGEKVKLGQTVTVDYDVQTMQEIPEIDLPVLYEDDDCIVINKPVGVLTHSKGAYNPEATVATFIADKITDENLSGDRAGIVHRLDRPTSGVIIAAKHAEALSWLQKQFSDRKVKKTYVALTGGHLNPEEAVIDMPIERNPKEPKAFRAGLGGRPAVTHYKVTHRLNKHDFVELYPETGRTHQLRVHLSQVGHPIVGDTLYKGETSERMYLHARVLEITLPNRERKVFTAETPIEFAKYLEENS
ncbi:MAG: ribosomal large subunit pseudouridine synthase, RluD subfamily protein nonfunctional [Candidatus Saccharibacteria bacterium]|nr:ribosomal large subunit pseudouridine synthase, RluD subfamily protein nonfunctional [Candidatus Saccharibacteria bacterium]